MVPENRYRFSDTPSLCDAAEAYQREGPGGGGSVSQFFEAKRASLEMPAGCFLIRVWRHSEPVMCSLTDGMRIQ